MEPSPPLFSKATGDKSKYKLAQRYYDHGDHIKVLEMIEDSILISGKHKVPSDLHLLQGSIFTELARKTESIDFKFAFLLASTQCYLDDYDLQPFASISFFELGENLGSVTYYKKALKIAKHSLSVMASSRPLNSYQQNTKTKLENLAEMAESRILLGPTVKDSEPKPMKFKAIRIKISSDSLTVAAKRLRPYWASMNVDTKRNFMTVSISKFTVFVERLYGREGIEALDQVVDSAKKNRKWKFWICRACSKKFFYPKKFKNHLEQEHAAKYKCPKEDMAQRVDEVWAGMISVVGWEPVDAVAAADMIKNQLEFVKKFVYVNGWSKDWPLAADEERRKLLKQIQLLLVSFWERKILPCSIQDWMMKFLVEHLAQFEVSEHTLTTECRLVETPQSICFLESHDLNQILDLLKQIKCKRYDGTELVSSATDSLWCRTLVNEKIEFDHEFSFMLLDKRLLRGKLASSDDEGSIDVFDRKVYYAKTHPQGDDIITWLLDHPLKDESFAFPRSIRAHNLDIWVAVLRAIHFTCVTLQIRCAKKVQILCYDACLNRALDICMHEAERRINVPEDQWNIYASLLREKCEEQLKIDDADPLFTDLFLCAVRDVLKGASYPTFNIPYLGDCLTLILGHKNVSDDVVLNSIDHLKSLVSNKVPLADSKILLVEISRIKLLNDLVRLSVFDYRSYILPLLKRFLQEELDSIVDMDAKAKLAAELLTKEKKEKEKKPVVRSKKKKHKSNKRTSASKMSSLLDQNVELEPGVTSLNMVQEGSMELGDILSSERDQLETSSNTNNEEEAIKDMDNMPRADSLPEHVEVTQGEAAIRYRSALDMTLKALLNIKTFEEDFLHNRQPFPGNLEAQIPYALQDLFSTFVSEQITEDGLYSYLLSNILASLGVHSMLSNAAEVVVAILEFCHCWKSPGRESLVIRLFTLEEYERMSCRKCRRKPNYPGQSSYGIIMGADSIRDLKCAFGNIKFVDILRVIRMEGKMICDVKTGGCGMENFIHHTISRRTPIFTIVLEWEKNETEKQISETTNALDWEIDISRLYEGLEPNTKYRLVSMVGCAEEGRNYICLAYKKTRWVSLRHEGLAEEVVGHWTKVVRFCGEKKFRPEILFYEAPQRHKE